MAAYEPTVANLLEWFGDRRTMRMLPEIQDDAARVALLERAITAAVARLEGAASAARYVVPLEAEAGGDLVAGVVEDLKQRVCVLAVEFLALGADQLGASLTAQIEAANRWLSDLQGFPAFDPRGGLTRTAQAVVIPGAKKL